MSAHVVPSVRHLARLTCRAFLDAVEDRDASPDRLVAALEARGVAHVLTTDDAGWSLAVEGLPLVWRTTHGRPHLATNWRAVLSTGIAWAAVRDWPDGPSWKRPAPNEPIDLSSAEPAAP